MAILSRCGFTQRIFTSFPRSNVGTHLWARRCSVPFSFSGTAVNQYWLGILAPHTGTKPVVETIMSKRIFPTARVCRFSQIWWLSYERREEHSLAESWSVASVCSNARTWEQSMGSPTLPQRLSLLLSFLSQCNLVISPSHTSNHI